METKQIKQLIKDELPGLLQSDNSLRNWIIEISQSHFAGKAVTESRFDTVLTELRIDREENQKKWENQEKKWEENQKEIRALVESVGNLSKKYDNSIGALGARWGIRSESSFRNGLKAILEDNFKGEVI